MSEENIYTFENEQYRKTYWHTCSHILAQAVKRLWPEVRAGQQRQIRKSKTKSTDSLTTKVVWAH